MEQPLVGRKEELVILNKALLSGEPEMVAVIGRRRVGKDKGRIAERFYFHSYSFAIFFSTKYFFTR